MYVCIYVCVKISTHHQASHPYVHLTIQPSTHLSIHRSIYLPLIVPHPHYLPPPNPLALSGIAFRPNPSIISVGPRCPLKWLWSVRGERRHLTTAGEAARGNRARKYSSMKTDSARCQIDQEGNEYVFFPNTVYFGGNRWYAEEGKGNAL